MSPVICDNAALSALAEIDHLNLLPLLFPVITVTESVRQEATHLRAPAALRQFMLQQPEWLAVEADPVPLHPITEGLEDRESSSITLAWENRADSLLVLDDLRARKAASALQLPHTGLVSILGHMAKEEFTDYDQAILNLRETGFHVSPTIVGMVRKRHCL